MSFQGRVGQVSVGTNTARPPLIEVDLRTLPADLSTVDLLARLQLIAQRGGSRVMVCNPPDGFGDLLSLLGLDSCLAVRVAVRVEVVSQAEEREEPGGVQEEGDPADPIA
jgi:ABC-type transporter Mla MlaB component